MRRLALAVAATLLAVGVGWALVWNESEKEVRVLCSMFHPGQPLEMVIETLDTGDFLRYTRETSGERVTIRVDSPYDLGRSTCTIDAVDGRVVRAVDD